jgi:hypothetical protein
VITSATITVTVDDTAKTVNFIVSGDEGRAKSVAKQVLEMIDADAAGNYFGITEDYQVQ